MDAPDWTKPITILTGTVISTQDFPDWTTAIVAVEGPVPGAGGTTYPMPANAIAETFPRAATGTPINLTSGVLQMSGIWLASGTTVGHIAFAFHGSETNNHWWFGLWDQSRAQLAVTADQLSASNGDPFTSLAVATTAAGAATSFTTTYTGLHYLGVVFQGSSPLVVMCPALQLTGISALQTPPILGGASTTGLTTPPTFPSTAAAIGPNLGLPYGWVLA
jgi:hypothetical protein